MSNDAQPPRMLSAPLRLTAMTLRGLGPYLHGARLDIKPLTILCGENGSGKSTWDWNALEAVDRCVSLDKSSLNYGAAPMNYPFPSDVEQRVQSQLETGLYPAEEDVLRAAMTALERERDDLASIQAGIEDMEAGRYRPFAQIDTEFRQKHNIPDKV